ncbi:LTA synthase family protein [Gluconacetobacter takamatsuzukensis]|uniref:LTA synthase family protein n=1 Tax=Gluconacetobacter takamatsuzukensis TaxID=1286190 RepID=A0A7W4KCX2_9PROT|nr:LTA synthase family protein [Gluconacetobacter takamatsuzukensis]MBB2204647.1 LTA synthase family protein [Gluconacetobacter takamatsuzukensis]
MQDWAIAAVSGLAIVALVILRITSGRPFRPLRNDLPDVAVALVLWLSLALLTRRPASSALLWVVLAAGLLLADHTKRAVLREPIVFADASELLLVFTHPRFYLPYVHPAIFYGIGGLLVGATAALFSIETPAMPGDPALSRLVGALLLIVPVAAYFWRPSLNMMAAVIRRLRPTGDPVEDAKTLGMLGSFAAHTVCSRQERPARQAACSFGIVTVPPDKPPVVLVQAESFFDIGRLDPALPSPLAEYQACRAQAWRHGRLDVDSWGANTTRSEFATISGASPADLGLDRFNPYYSFARRPLDTLAARMRQAGYLTVCVHPYDRRFYGRHKVMPNLGFDHFIGGEAFESRRGELVADEVLGAWINDFIARETRPVFVFAITVANHGPWAAEATTDSPFAPMLGGYLDSLMGTDRMIGQLAGSRWLNEEGGIFALYGDHQPSLPVLLNDGAHIGASTDYFILDRTRAAGPRQDIRVDQLGRELALCLRDHVPMPRALTGR